MPSRTHLGVEIRGYVGRVMNLVRFDDRRQNILRIQDRLPAHRLRFSSPLKLLTFRPTNRERVFRDAGMKK